MLVFITTFKNLVVEFVAGCYVVTCSYMSTRNVYQMQIYTGIIKRGLRHLSWKNFAIIWNNFAHMTSEMRSCLLQALSKKQNISCVTTTNCSQIYSRKEKIFCTRYDRLPDLYGECLQEEPICLFHTNSEVTKRK